jgi:hypothetical protein
VINSRRDSAGGFGAEPFVFARPVVCIRRPFRFPHSLSPFHRLVFAYFQTQSQKHIFLVRQVPHDPAPRERAPYYEHGHRRDLIVPGQMSLLVDVDDFQVIAIL